MSYHSGNQLLDPYLIFQHAHLQKGMHVADFGCGRTGHIIFPASRIIGERGILYAVDIIKDVLENITKRARTENLLNVHTVWSDLESVGSSAIPEGSLDAVFLVNTLHQSNNRHAVLEEARRLLKDKARLVIADWERDGLPLAPPKGRFVDWNDLINWSKMHGFAVQEEFQAGKYHKGVVLFRQS